MTDLMPPPMFDLPQIVTEGDTARARRSDPITSHIAADVSKRSMRQTKVAVLEIVLQEGEIVGSELNELYRLRSSRHGWGRIAFDTPRKRAGELADDGYLEVVRYELGGNNLPESVYSITDKGRAHLEAVAS